MKIPKPSSRYLLAAFSLLLAGTAAFAIGRYALSDDAPVGAQVGPVETPNPEEVRDISEIPESELPTPPPEIAARRTAVADDNAKPRFTGELNGFTFLGDGTPFPDPVHNCTRGELREVRDGEARSVIQGSDVDFEATYLPSGSRLTVESSVLCGEEVISAGQAWELDSGRVVFSAIRMKGNPVFPAHAPEERMKAVTIAGRAAVVVEPLDPVNPRKSTVIYMLDDDGTIWGINAELPTAEAIKFAEGLQ
jgi:hypothetical protein